MPAPIISACHLGLGIAIFKTITEQSQYYWSLLSTTGSDFSRGAKAGVKMFTSD